jgi:hypothetical protein
MCGRETPSVAEPVGNTSDGQHEAIYPNRDQEVSATQRTACMHCIDLRKGTRHVCVMKWLPHCRLLSACRATPTMSCVGDICAAYVWQQQAPDLVSHQPAIPRTQQSQGLHTPTVPAAAPVHTIDQDALLLSSENNPRGISPSHAAAVSSSNPQPAQSPVLPTTPSQPTTAAKTMPSPCNQHPAAYRLSHRTDRRPQHLGTCKPTRHRGVAPDRAVLHCHTCESVACAYASLYHEQTRCRAQTLRPTPEQPCNNKRHWQATWQLIYIIPQQALP